MRKRLLVIITIAVIFTVVSMYLLSNIADINIPLMILMSMLVMNIFMMLFLNIFEIIRKRNLKFNILSAIAALNTFVMITSIVMMSFKSIQLTEFQNDILLFVMCISTITFFILATICSNLEKKLKNLSNKINDKEKESEEM